MRKSIFAISLYFNCFATALAVANPLNLFVDQCLQFNAIQEIAIPQEWQLSATSHPSLSMNSGNSLVEFEATLLTLNNLNDRNNYYRNFTKHPEQQQQLLNCQVHLADELSALLNNIDANQLEKDLIHRKQNNAKDASTLYIKTIQHIQKQQLSYDVKSQLHSLQAMIRHYFMQDFSFHATKSCALAEIVDNAQESPKAKSTTEANVAHYLLSQTDDSCRQQAWFAYQTRVKPQNKLNLLALHKLKNQLAVQSGFSNVADHQLSVHSLTAAQLNRFLDSQTINIELAPWDLPRELQALPKVSVAPHQSLLFLEQMFTLLSEFDLRFELISTTDNPFRLYRVWLSQRLLGEIYVELDEHTSKINHHRIKQAVIGHQFGQYGLKLPLNLTTVKQHNDVVFIVSDIINQLAKGSPFYYLNHQDISLANQSLGSYWLSAWFVNKLGLEYTTSARVQLLQSFAQQQRIFKAKVALLFYQQADLSNYFLYESSLHKSVSNAFNDSFGVPWPTGADAIFSYQAIANQGISYYLLQWQETLAQLILNETLSSSQAKDIFDVLIVNEHNQAIYDQLSAIFKQPMDFENLLRRINYAGTKQE
ncbi:MULTISPECIES: hypothetical protein [Pseudomonadati]|uniref:Peptidase M3A/M3B catalytic domain-containing protein n=1 Tax=Shewanella aestuarii TaxID=1028752 RepID=A0ABT0KXI6_9GAMM|nr:hypothetical protein [Shewanella aestuarii]MCL1115960.1 hypothetical protein [Shewanella aestuarii]GGN69705.1 Zn-dependent oligopeptidase [Shewanella aestuarii]